MEEYPNTKSQGPIGIFDSGVGGLTVAQALRAILPGENILYYGDTLHLPYGEKSKEAIIRYSTEITTFLLSKGAKCILIACNSASANAAEYLREKFPHTTFIDVIQPVVDHIQQLDKKSIGVIGTKATMNSGAYQRKLLESLPNAKIITKATPLLAAMIEEGFTSGPVTDAVIDAYLHHDAVSHTEALVLGCTHYPLIQNNIRRVLPENCLIIDTPKIVAKSIVQHLENQNMLNNHSVEGQIQFFLSDLTPSFRKQANLFFGKDIEIEEVRVLSN
ncbi:MAG: glutamate racemase [Cryomorphaceae bacterium]|nr:glutamate racemase [Cryomorphaceae bacterium]